MRHVPSPPARGAWIETLRRGCTFQRRGSPPARGAWIETYLIGADVRGSDVAPRAGGVD